MKPGFFVALAVLFVGCGEATNFDTEAFVDEGLGFVYDDGAISNPQALPSSLGPAIRTTVTDFGNGTKGAFDTVTTFYFQSLAVEYYSFKNLDGKASKHQLKAIYAQPGATYQGIHIGMAESEVRARIPALGASKTWIGSSSYHEVAFDFKDGKLTGIVWTRSSE